MEMPMISYIYISATRRLACLVHEQDVGKVLRIMQMRLCASSEAGLDAQGRGTRIAWQFIENILESISIKYEVFIVNISDS